MAYNVTSRCLLQQSGGNYLGRETINKGKFLEEPDCSRAYRLRVAQMDMVALPPRGGNVTEIIHTRTTPPTPSPVTLKLPN